MTTTPSPAAAATNPLLERSGLPPFDRITPQHVRPAVEATLAELERTLAEIEDTLTPTWDGLMRPLEDLSRPLEYTWSPVKHLLSVRNSESIREAHQEMLPKIVDFGLRIEQSRPIYEGLKALRDSDEWQSLDEAQQRAVEIRLRDMEHAGVGLDPEKRRRFNEIARELSKIATDFSNNVLDATKAFSLVIADKADTEGWPKNLRQIAAQSYNEVKPEDDPPATPEEGPWRITLDGPSFGPFMQHSRNREHREHVYKAFMTRASEGNLDNRPLIDRVLRLRAEQTALLGFESYAALSLDSKMAPNVEAVEEMFEELRAAGRPHALKDREAWEAMAKERAGIESFAHWDIAFWAERLREERYDFTDDQLRPYFPLPRVLDGLFSLSERLFGISIEPADGRAPVWHEDVRFFVVRGETGAQLASFYLDPYSRPQEKRGGAWADICLNRRIVDGELQLPVVHLCCNGTPPVGDTPSLMSFREVETLFHEFGHGLQAMLTTVDHADVSGLNGIEWDAVEIASQFMENWCYHKPTLVGMTRHVETGEPLPDDLFDKLAAARTYAAGSGLVRQLEFGMTDMRLHHGYDPETDDRTPFDVHREVTEITSAFPPFEDNRFLCAFSHIFAGGYAAGYYSYKWSEVLSADAFAAFEEAGLDNEHAVRELGRKYRDTILASGGGREPMAVFRDFREREPSTEALLRHHGLDRPPANEQ